MAIDKAYCVARAPYLADTSITDAEWTAALADAALQVDAPTWEKVRAGMADYVTFLLVAHRLCLVHPKLEPKALVSVAAGGVSKTNAQPMPAWAGSLSATTWGREYAEMLERLPRIFSLGC